MKKRVYILGAGASCTLGIPAMNSLTWEICKFLPKDRRAILEQVVFEVFGSREERGDPSPNFEELLNYLDPRSFTYLEGCGIDPSEVGRTQAIEIVLQGLREYIQEQCKSIRNDLGPYDRFVASLEPNATVIFSLHPGMCIAPVKSNVAHNPIAVGLLGTVGVMMITKYLPDLVHKRKAGIKPEYMIAFRKNIVYL